MNDKAIEAEKKNRPTPKPDGLCWWGSGECMNPQTNRTWYCKEHESPSLPAPAFDTRGEVPDRQRSKLDPLVLLIARIKSIHGNVSDALSQQRILHELGRLLKLAYSIEASVLSELSALREENERLKAKVAEFIWGEGESATDQINRLQYELATLRASASSAKGEGQ